MTALGEELKWVSGHISRNDCFLLPALTPVSLSDELSWAISVMLLSVASIKLQRGVKWHREEEAQLKLSHRIPAAVCVWLLNACFKYLILHIRSQLCSELRLTTFCWGALGQDIWPCHPFSPYSMAKSRRLRQLLNGNTGNCWSSIFSAESIFPEWIKRKVSSKRNWLTSSGPTYGRELSNSLFIPYFSGSLFVFLQMCI